MQKIMSILPFVIIFGTFCFAQETKIKKGSTVYVDAMHGYGMYIVAALQKEHVPVTIVTTRDKAQYVIQGVVNHKDLDGNSGITVNNTNAVNAHQGSVILQREAATRAFGETSTSIMLVDPKSGQIIFSDSTDEMGNGQLEHGAQDFAKHLKKFIEKGK